MAPLSIQIIPAQPGFFTIIDFDDEREVAIDQPVIAWRVETFNTGDGSGVFSTCIAITVDGDVVSNCIGVQNPNGTVTVFGDMTCASLDSLQKIRYPSKQNR